MAENLFPWLSDVDRAAQYLTSLTLSTAAQAALIIQAEQLWAYAGELVQPAVQELLKAVLKNWAAGSGKDFAQFVALESSASEYLLYVTRLSEGMLLVLAFDVEVPFSKIRSQARRLASALKAPPGTVSLDQDDQLPEESFAQMRIEPLFPLEDIPPPTPPVATRYGKAQHESRPGHSEAAYDVPQAANELIELAGSGGLEAQEADTSWAAQPQLQYEAASPQINIGYAFVLVPRLPAHNLAGELAIAVDADLRQLSVAFGWRLERLVIRPDHIQWIARVPPNTSPSRLVRLMRKHTSSRLFSRFPHLERDNPSGDFWAPGYLVISGNQLLPAQDVRSFIQQTRFHQGASA